MQFFNFPNTSQWQLIVAVAIKMLKQLPQKQYFMKASTKIPFLKFELYWPHGSGGDYFLIFFFFFFLTSRWHGNQPNCAFCINFLWLIEDYYWNISVQDLSNYLQSHRISNKCSFSIFCLQVNDYKCYI